MLEQYKLLRNAETLVKEALSDTRIVLLQGARQSGKSTLARHIAKNTLGAKVFHLDDPATLSAAKYDPVSFIEHDGLVVIDEIQRAPELLLPLKLSVDLNPSAGRFLLTGSARVLGMKAVPDALTGRMEIIELWPFAQNEIEKTKPTFIDYLLKDALDQQNELVSKVSKKSYAEKVSSGGFPEVLERQSQRRVRAFFASYLTTLIERDIKDISQIEKVDTVNKILKVLASRVAMPLVKEGIVKDVKVSASTVERYITLLEHVFVVKRIPAWSTNATARAVSHPKLLFVDSGIAAYLAGWNAEKISSGAEIFGSLLENFVLSELARLLDYTQEPVKLYHFRTRDAVEVDAILETGNGEIVGVEVKASSTISNRDFQGLKYLERRVGDKLIGGFVLYTGDKILSFGEKFMCIPISMLWDRKE